MARFEYFTNAAFSTFDSLSGGTILSRTPRLFVYQSEQGFIVKLHGNYLRYDDDGIATSGSIHTVDLYNATGKSHLASYSGLFVAATDFMTLALGKTSQAADVPTDVATLIDAMRQGSDSIVGSGYDRFFDGFAGNDTFIGGAGDEWFFGGQGTDLYYGGEGNDGVSFSAGAEHGVVMSATQYALTITDDGTGSPDGWLTWETSIEFIETGNFDDLVTLGSETLSSAYNEMTFNLLDGNDTFWTRRNDTVFGGSGNDSLTGSWHTVMDGGDGKDQFEDREWGAIVAFWSADTGGHGASVNLGLDVHIRDDGFGNREIALNVSNFYGTRFDDIFIAGTAAVEFYGNDGNDSLVGRAGDDTLSGGGDKDSLYGGDGNDLLNGGAGLDNFVGGLGTDILSFLGQRPNGHGVVVNLNLADGQIRNDGSGHVETIRGIEILIGSERADRMTGNGQGNEFWGESGDDTLVGGAGNDLLSGGYGSDSLLGGLGNDTLLGGQNGDLLYGGDGNDTFRFIYSSVGGNCTTTGGAGTDRFLFDIAAPEFVSPGRITDMAHGTDKIALPQWWTTGFDGQTTLRADQFRMGSGVTSATTGNHHVLYDTSTGNLYFDVDGSFGTYSTILIATLANHPALTYTDFALWT